VGDGTDGSSAVTPIGLGGIDLTSGGSQDGVNFGTGVTNVPLSASP